MGDLGDPSPQFKWIFTSGPGEWPLSLCLYILSLAILWNMGRYFEDIHVSDPPLYKM